MSNRRFSGRYGKNFQEALDTGTVDFESVISPRLLRIVGDPCGQTVLELGCGTGRLCRLLANAGVSVHGVDRNNLQIIEAQEGGEATLGTLRYTRADILQLVMGSFGLFDFVLLCFVLLDVPDPKDVAAILEFAGSSLHQDGRLIIMDSHPHNLSRPNDLEYCELEVGKKYADLGAKFRSDVRLKDGRIHTFSPNYHYSIEFIIATCRARGLMLDQLYEECVGTQYPTHLTYVFTKRPDKATVGLEVESI